jgi:hypothetical protein
MSLYITRSTPSKSKRHRVVHLSLAMPATLALFITASPPISASPEPQSAQPAQALQAPNAVCPPDGQCFADVPPSSPFYLFINRLYQQDVVSGYACGGPNEPCDPQSRPYYRPASNVTRQQMSKFLDNARRLPEIHMDVRTGYAPIYSRNDTGTAIAAYSTSGQAFVALSQSQLAIYAQTGNTTAIAGVSTGGASGIGVQGNGSTGVKGTSTSASGYGVWGVSTSNVGVYGTSTSGYGVYGQSTSGTGVGVQGVSTDGEGIDGISTNFYGVAGQSYNDVGVIGFSDASDAVVGISTNGRAGHFEGSVQVDGILSKGGGSFKIDHPLDPANQYLYHSFVESPDMMNVYNGNVTLDAQGEAIVQLPDWFGALNKEYRYQLTAVGAPGPNLYVSKKVEGNRFIIAGGTPGMEVSWQVTGIRQDPFANAHRIPVEEDKPASEKGKYLHPTEWGQPASAGIDYERQQQMQEAMQSKP